MGLSYGIHPKTLMADGDLLSDDPAIAAAERNAAANELFSLPELPDGVVADLARMFWSPDEDEVWRDYCLQFLGSALLDAFETPNPPAVDVARPKTEEDDDFSAFSTG